MNGHFQSLSRNLKHLPSYPIAAGIVSISPARCEVVLHHCANNISLTTTKRVHAYTFRSGLLSSYDSNHLLSLLVAAYAVCGQISYARTLFDELPQRTLRSYKSMIRMYAEIGSPKHLLGLFREMLESDFHKADRYTYPFVIRACGDLLLLESGIAVHGLAVISGNASGSFTGNSLLAMYMKFGDMERARNLEVEVVTLGKVQLKESTFQAFTESPMLRSLTINGAIFASGVLEIPLYHERLQTLNILKCRVTRISIRCPLLETLSLRRSSMPLLALTSPLLKYLDIATCHKLSDATIRSTVISCPLLETLNMANCSCVTNDTLREIAHACANLHILDASYCPKIFLENVRLPMLKVLKLNSCERINSASMAAISRSYMLETLELDTCSSLISVSLDLPCLMDIRLVHCRKFVDLNLRSGMLSSITVSNCPYLQGINITSSKLKVCLV